MQFALLHATHFPKCKRSFWYSMHTNRVQVVCKLYVRIRVVCLYAFPNIAVVFATHLVAKEMQKAPLMHVAIHREML